jgi:hypothetical protein
VRVVAALRVPGGDGFRKNLEISYSALGFDGSLSALTGRLNDSQTPDEDQRAVISRRLTHNQAQTSTNGGANNQPSDQLSSRAVKPIF